MTKKQSIIGDSILFILCISLFLYGVITGNQIIINIIIGFIILEVSLVIATLYKQIL